MSDNIFDQNKSPNFQISVLSNIKDDSTDTVIGRKEDFRSFKSYNESQMTNPHKTQGSYF
jgi:hypothetical protein